MAGASTRGRRDGGSQAPRAARRPGVLQRRGGHGVVDLRDGHRERSGHLPGVERASGHGPDLSAHLEGVTRGGTRGDGTGGGVRDCRGARERGVHHGSVAAR